MEFVTRQAGVLLARKGPENTVQMTLPLDPPTMSINSENQTIWKVMKTALPQDIEPIQVIAN